MQVGDNIDQILRDFRRGIACEVRGCYEQASIAITRVTEARHYRTRFFCAGHTHAAETDKPWEICQTVHKPA